MNQMTHDLTPFCSPDKTTYDHYVLDSPWIHNGWQYATDGRICVRQPTLQPTIDDVHRPAVAHLFRNFPACLQPWPKHDGEVVEVDCSRCGMRAPKPITLAGRKIAGRYCVKIQALGDVQYGPVGEYNEPLSLVCGELQGLVHGLFQ